ncbi:hypothetical protein PENSPDRAFT_752825 [Peniophora sp. CONT]|nr:hypothetical protein PENSPDRAFT_752825 [Peniophora sp. CONT]
MRTAYRAVGTELVLVLVFLLAHPGPSLTIPHKRPTKFSMPPRLALLPRRLATVVRFGRPTFRKRLTQRPEDASVELTTTASLLSINAPLSTAAVSDNLVSPTATTNSLSPSRSRTRSRELAKETLLLGLQGLLASADAFPPLKSAVGGLLFFVDQIELASDNKTQVLNIYANISTIASSLARAIPDGTELSRAHEAALSALTSEIQLLCTSLEGIAHERKRPIKRFICAKRHRAQLEEIGQRLNNGDASFMRTMISSAEATGAKVLSCLQEKHHISGATFFLAVCPLKVIEASEGSFRILTCMSTAVYCIWFHV